MAAPLKAVDGTADLQALMSDLATRARAAARVLALAPPEQKNRALEAMERAIREHAPAIRAANAEDVAEARASGTGNQRHHRDECERVHAGIVPDSAMRVLRRQHNFAAGRLQSCHRLIDLQIIGFLAKRVHRPRVSNMARHFWTASRVC